MCFNYPLNEFPLYSFYQCTRPLIRTKKIRNRKVSITFYPQQIETSFFQHWLPCGWAMGIQEYAAHAQALTGIHYPCFCNTYFNLTIYYNTCKNVFTYYLDISVI